MQCKTRIWTGVVWDVDPIATKPCRFALVGTRVLVRGTAISAWRRLVNAPFAGVMPGAGTWIREWRYIHEITYEQQTVMHNMAAISWKESRAQRYARAQ